MTQYWAVKTYVAPLVSVARHPGRLFSLMTPRTTDQWARDGRLPAVVLTEVILLASFLWLLFVWSRFGGAVTRIAAVEIAKDERITTNEALDYSNKKFSSYFWSPLSVLIAFMFFYLCNSLGAVLTWIPYAGPVLVGLVSIFAFLSAFVALLIAVGGVFGWPLMSPAVSAEGTDAFDAVSRAFSYVYSRPWQYAFYWIVSAVYGAFCIGFVWLFTYALISLTFTSAQVGAGKTLDASVRAIFSYGEGTPFVRAEGDEDEEEFALPVLKVGKDGKKFVAPPKRRPPVEKKPEKMGVPDVILTVILGTFVVLLTGFGGSYAVSFFFTQRTLMYFILRKRVDNTEMNEVYMEEEEEDLFGEGKDEDKEKPESSGEKSEGGEACADAPAKPETGEKKPEAPAAGAGPKAAESAPGTAEPPKP
jgi:hypothetical protein